jgi:hypothetical protein
MCADDEERMVPNPYLAAIQRLVTRTETAVDETPNMDAPTESIGEGPAWTGRKAREIHDDYLSPNAEPVRIALNNLVSDVETRKGEIDPEVTERMARLIQNDLLYR